MRTLQLVLLALVAGSPLKPQDTLHRDVANMAHEMTKCVAYLTIISQMPGNPENLRNTYLAMADSVGRRAIELTGDSEVLCSQTSAGCRAYGG
jgi:hypothetical protein